MSDLTYRLVVDLSTTGTLGPALAGANASAAKLGGSLKSVGSEMKSLASSAAGAFTAVGDMVVGAMASAGKIAGVALAGGVAYGVTHINAELEKMQVSLAAIFSAQGVSKGMVGGMRIAGDTIKEMRRDAAQLPGEFKDLLGFFRLGATPGLALGASVPQLEKMSANAMAAAAATGVNMEQAAREYAQLLQGRSGSHNVFGALLGLTGDDAAKFNKLEGGARLKKVEELLGKYKESSEFFGQTYEALSSTMLDNGKRLLGGLTGGVFERVKLALSDANSWFDKNENVLMQHAEVLGEQLGYAFDVARKKITEWWPAIKAFATHMGDAISGAFERIGPVLDALGPRIKAALADPATIGKIGHAGTLYAGLKVGSALAPAASSVGSMASGALGAVGIGGAAAGAVAVAALLAVGGALHILADDSNYFHGMATKTVTHMGEQITPAMTSLEASFERVAPLIVAVADTLGANFLVMLDGLAIALRGVAAAADFTTGNMSALMKTLGLAKMADDKPEPIERDPVGIMTIKAMNTLSNQLDESGAPKHKKGAGGGGGGTHIQKVEIVLTTNQDPSRIARLTVEKLQDISRFPTSSRHARNFSAAR